MRVPALTILSACSHWTLAVTGDWVDFGFPSSHLRVSVDCADLSSRQPDPEASSDRHSLAVALSSSLAVAVTLAIAVRLVVFKSWLSP